MKRLYRSKKNRVFAGIFGGLGEYFEVDPVLLRVIWIFLFVMTGILPGALAYFIAMFVMPEHSEASRGE